MNNNRVEVAKKTQEVHQQNIQKSLEHRLQVARLRGDEKLIHQLEAEIEQYK